MKRNYLSRWWQSRRADLAALAVIVLFFALFFPQALFCDKYVLAGDAFYYTYPLRSVAWNMLRHGTLPTWTPLIFSGYPLLSMAQLGLGYPLVWGYLFLPGYVAEEVYVLAPFILAPAFTYAFAREVGRSRLAALLAGLSFGYGGMMASPLANNGMLPNALLWLPLILIALERARTRPFVPCLLAATGAYTMSVLTGIGQGFLYVGLLALTYALWLVVASNTVHEHGWRDWRARRNWRPLVVAVGSIVLAMGVAAFQILETARAVRRSVRSVLDYETFTEGSFTLSKALSSVVAPLYHYIDVLAYVPALALLLAVTGLACAALRRDAARRDPRVCFWLVVAVAAFVLMLGGNTPLYRLLYYVPFMNRFRVPSRHAFEWTFAVAVLAAYGWDALSQVIADRRRTSELARVRRAQSVGALVLLLAGGVVGALWWRAVQMPPPPGTNAFSGLSEIAYLGWKTIFTLLLLLAIWQAQRLPATKWRAVILSGAIALGCYVEPSAYLSRWWGGLVLWPERFTAASAATRFLQQYPPEQNRVYTRVELYSEEFEQAPRLDGANLTALYGLHNVAGYEPLILERYSRALGGVALDALSPRPGSPKNLSLFTPQSHVLDLLNTTFAVSYANLATHVEETLPGKDGIKFAATDTIFDVKPQASETLPGALAQGDTLALVTMMANSTAEQQGSPVAGLRIVATDGRVIERELRAGIDTSEWAHDRPDVRGNIRHELSPIFDSRPGDAGNNYQSYRFWTRIPLGERVRLDHVEVVNLSRAASVVVWKATLYDSVSSHSTPLTNFVGPQWEPVYNRDAALILRNTRALPRVWLAPEAEAVDGEEALRRIRGESAVPFDPRRTALLEVAANELPALTGGALSPESGAQIVAYEPNRLLVETHSDRTAVLVISEINYPGWVATLDGAPVPVHQTNFLLRGVIVPAGKHRVEMRYTAPAARVGASISLFTLALLIGLAIYEWRTRLRKENE